MDTLLMRVAVLGAFAAALGLAAPAAAADKLDTAAFVTACTEDPTVTEDPGFEGGSATPKAFCECVADKLVENKSTQADLDMLTKLHNEEISDSDAETHPNFESLLVANEGYEDACRQSLGLSTDYGTDIEEVPMEEEVPEGVAPDGEAPLEDSPPE
ncbi:MAG: hypothetical protein ACAH04_07490 [Methylibium sp.]|jgi:hypothetical protein|nr:hypothetical protein [Methyloceanibacter sp.]